MKVQINDGNFSRTHCRHICGGGGGLVPWTTAEDCTNGEAESDKRTSLANLEKTEIKFPENVESLYIARGHLPRGDAEVSSEGKQLRVESAGDCGTTSIPAYYLEVIIAA